MERTAVIIPAAGGGRRMGLKTPKPFLPLMGAPILARTIDVFERSRRVGLIQPVLPRAYLSRFNRRLLERYSWTKCRAPVAGGRERQDSVERGLESLPADCEAVMIHDAARPFVTQELIEKVLDAALRHGAALAALPVSDTVKRSSGGKIVADTLDRSGLWLAQTPQAFRTDLLRRAYRLAGAAGRRATDDASLVESAGHPVRLVAGSPGNLKITTREDLKTARAILRGRMG